MERKQVLRVAETETRGWGLFNFGGPIMPGEQIDAPYFIDESEDMEKYWEREGGSLYAVDMEGHGGGRLDASKKGTPGGDITVWPSEDLLKCLRSKRTPSLLWVNHSRKFKNVVWADKKVGGVAVALGMKACKRIERGDEVLVDYGNAYFTEGLKKGKEIRHWY